jgi:hypothetical protein
MAADHSAIFLFSLSMHTLSAVLPEAMQSLQSFLEPFFHCVFEKESLLLGCGQPAQAIAMLVAIAMDDISVFVFAFGMLMWTTQ